jgi:hypothetical protein
MPNLWLQEHYQYSTGDECWSGGDSGQFETWSDVPGKLFRALQKEYGKCVSYVYLSTPKGDQPVGWVFEKHSKTGRDKVVGSVPTKDIAVLQRTWCTLFTAKDVVVHSHKDYRTLVQTTEMFYYFLKGGSHD